MTTSTITIDCQSCPVRGRLCGDCFVPVLGRVWLQDPTQVAHPGRSAAEHEGRAGHPGTAPHDTDEHKDVTDGRVRLDTDELAAVSAFVRAGLVDPDEAAAARAELTGPSRVAAG